MQKIYSRFDKNRLLHIVVRKADILMGRQDIIDPDNFLQCSTMQMNAGTTFKPHYHIWKVRNKPVIAQESWIVIEGKVRCIYYDTDNQVIAASILLPGDASFTLEGGHNYEVMENETIVYEYKTGPYEGQEKDKKFI